MKTFTAAIKAAFAAFLMLSFMLIFSVNTGAIEIDGSIGRTEWMQGGEFIVVSTDLPSNCGIKFAYMKALVSEEERRIYLSFKCIDSLFVEGSGLSGAEVYINGEKTKTAAFSDSSRNIYNAEKYSLGSAFIENVAQKEFYCEMYVGVKFGLPQRILLGVRVIDCKGEPSNYYEFLIREPSTAEEEDCSRETKELTSTTAKKTTTTLAKTSTSRASPSLSSTSLTSTTQHFTTVKFVPYVKPTATTAKAEKSAAKKTTASVKIKSSAKKSAKKTVSTTQTKTTAAPTICATEEETGTILLTSYSEMPMLVLTEQTAATNEETSADTKSRRKTAAIAAISSVTAVSAVGGANAAFRRLKIRRKK